MLLMGKRGTSKSEPKGVRNMNANLSSQNMGEDGGLSKKCEGGLEKSSWRKKKNPVR